MIDLTFSPDMAKALRQQSNHTFSPVKTEEILSLCLLLDAGDISRVTAADISSRDYFLREIFTSEASEILAENKTTLRILNSLKSNDILRMWVKDGDAGDLCGVYFVCDILRSRSAFLIVAQVPENSGEGINLNTVNYVTLTDSQKLSHSLSFNSLKNTNSPTRIVKNGDIISI